MKKLLTVVSARAGAIKSRLWKWLGNLQQSWPRFCC